MAHAQEALIADDIEAYLRAHEHKSLLRFITCGSVDDGKSTLIGRLLYESHLVFEDHLAALEADSRTVGTQGGDLDFALLVDGLTAEREQGITIDVAYRFFSTERRKFIVADTPGHEQYTRNMVTGASTADLAVILIDARRGVLTQTRRHSFLVKLIGIEHVVVAVNKLDLVDYDQSVFDSIEADYRAFASEIGITDITCIPMSALRGDNIIERSEHTPWYDGPTLLGHLEEVDVEDRAADGPFRMPVEWVNRPHLDYRGFSGLITSGTVRPGDRIRTLPSGRTSTVARIDTFDGDLDEAVAGQSVTLLLADEIDISRGDVLVRRGRARSGRRPVRGPHRVDARRATRAGAALPRQDRHPHRRSHDRSAEVQGERQHAGADRDQDARAQRDRRVHPHHRPADPVRSLRRAARHRRHGPHRPTHERDTRMRARPLLAAAGTERALAGDRRHPRGPQRPQGPSARDRVVHGSLRRREVDHREPGRAAPPRAACTPTCSTATTCATD